MRARHHYLPLGGAFPAAIIMKVRNLPGWVMDPPNTRRRVIEILDDIEPIPLAFSQREAELRLCQPYPSKPPGTFSRLDLDVALRPSGHISDEDVVALVLLRHLLDLRT